MVNKLKAKKEDLEKTIQYCKEEIAKAELKMEVIDELIEEVGEDGEPDCDCENKDNLEGETNASFVTME